MRFLVKVSLPVEAGNAAIKKDGLKVIQRILEQQMAALFTKALGEEVRYNDVPPEVYRRFGFHGADDLANMFQFKRDFNEDYCRPRNLDLARSLNPSLQTFDEWIAENRDRIPLEKRQASA